MSPIDLNAVPPDLVDELRALRQRLSDDIPSKRLDHNLLVATWNIRAFGDLCESWIPSENDRPKRNLYALRCIAEIVARFDVIAIQETRDNIKALRHMLKHLGPDWGLIMTDVTVGEAGNDERMAFVFDTRRVKTSGLAGELVVPPEWIEAEHIEPNALRTQFARTPYAVSFSSGQQTFILVTLHVLYGESAEHRLGELRGIAKWLEDWAKREQSWGHNLIALGDFNIDRKDDDAYKAFTSTGLRSPPELDTVPRTIFKSGKKAFYDQIAWFTRDGNPDVPVLSLRYSEKAGGFDFKGLVMPALDDIELSWRISDHYPLWTEFLLTED
ncbi:MAG: endonuclease/exonuclease/phosphatase family protein [Actinomycetota bacterium]